jgi:hypothetical protein
MTTHKLIDELPLWMLSSGKNGWFRKFELLFGIPNTVIKYTSVCPVFSCHTETVIRVATTRRRCSLFVFSRRWVACSTPEKRSGRRRMEVGRR